MRRKRRTKLEPKVPIHDRPSSIDGVPSVGSISSQDSVSSRKDMPSESTTYSKRKNRKSGHRKSKTKDKTKGYHPKSQQSEPENSIERIKSPIPTSEKFPGAVLTPIQQHLNTAQFESDTVPLPAIPRLTAGKESKTDQINGVTKHEVNGSENKVNIKVINSKSKGRSGNKIRSEAENDGEKLETPKDGIGLKEGGKTYRVTSGGKRPGGKTYRVIPLADITRMAAEREVPSDPVEV